MVGAGVDPNTGLPYNQARWYDPHTGQFMVVDPKVQTTWQTYAYAKNDPITVGGYCDTELLRAELFQS